MVLLAAVLIKLNMFKVVMGSHRAGLTQILDSRGDGGNA